MKYWVDLVYIYFVCNLLLVYQKPILHFIHFQNGGIIQFLISNISKTAGFTKNEKRKILFSY